MTIKFYLPLFCAIFWSVQLAAQLPSNMYADNAHAPFLYGVASGDPLPNKVIIWTRIAPDSATAVPISIFWEMATDTAFTNIVNSGTFQTSAARDWTVKVDADLLTAYTTYYYRFRDPSNNYSSRGRTKTAPVGNAVGHVRAAVASCSSIYSGFFNAYRRIAARTDLDFVIHLGDYIYDFVDEDEEIRVPNPYPVPPNSLQEWRDLHSYYLLDPDFRAAKQEHPWIILWDNHDLDRNGSSYLGSVQAFMEYTPIRIPDTANVERIYRTFQYGNMIDLILADILVWRDIDTLSGGGLSILGNTQYQWLTNELSSSTATWKLLGNQKMMGGWSVAGFPSWFPLGNGQVLDPNSWDGYDQERDVLLSFILNNGINNVAVLSGDAHVSMATELSIDPYDFLTYNSSTGQGSIAVEFLPTSISRGNLDEMGISGFFLNLVIGASDLANPHHFFSNLTKHGYGLLDIKSDSIVAEFWYSNILAQTSTESFEKGLVLKNGENHWRRVFNTTAMPPKPDTTVITSTEPFVQGDKNLHVFPNPSNKGLFEVTWSANQALSSARITVYAMDGKVLECKWVEKAKNHVLVDISNFPNGIYVLKIQQDSQNIDTALLRKN